MSRATESRRYLMDAWCPCSSTEVERPATSLWDLRPVPDRHGVLGRVGRAIAWEEEEEPTLGQQRRTSDTDADQSTE